MSATPQRRPADFRALVAANERTAHADLHALHATVTLLVSAVESLAAEVAALRTDRRPQPAPRLLSLRAAARALGVSRNRTLPALIRDRRIRVVTVNGRTKVPMEEIERIGREGFEILVPGRRDAPSRGRREAPLARDLV